MTDIQTEPEPEAIKANKAVLETIRRLEASAKHKINVYGLIFGDDGKVHPGATIEIDGVRFTAPTADREAAAALVDIVSAAFGEQQMHAVELNRLHPPTEAEIAETHAAARGV